MVLAVLLPRIPPTNQLAPVDGWRTMLDEPSRLPIVFADILQSGALWKFAPMASIAMKPAAPEKLPTKAVVWSIPEIMFPWMTVDVALFAAGISIPRNVLSDPLMTVLAVPRKLPNPMMFPVMV